MPVTKPKPVQVNDYYDNDNNGLWSWYLSNIRNGMFEELTENILKITLLKRFLKENFQQDINSTSQHSTNCTKILFTSIPDNIHQDLPILENLLKDYFDLDNLDNIQILKLTQNRCYNHENHYILKDILDNFGNTSFFIHDGTKQKIPPLKHKPDSNNNINNLDNLDIYRDEDNSIINSDDQQSECPSLTPLNSIRSSHAYSAKKSNSITQENSKTNFLKLSQPAIDPLSLSYGPSNPSSFQGNSLLSLRDEAKNCCNNDEQQNGIVVAESFLNKDPNIETVDDFDGSINSHPPLIEHFLDTNKIDEDNTEINILDSNYSKEFEAKIKDDGGTDDEETDRSLFFTFKHKTLPESEKALSSQENKCDTTLIKTDTNLPTSEDISFDSFNTSNNVLERNETSYIGHPLSLTITHEEDQNQKIEQQLLYRGDNSQNFRTDNIENRNMHNKDGLSNSSDKVSELSKLSDSLNSLNYSVTESNSSNLLSASSSNDSSSSYSAMSILPSISISDSLGHFRLVLQCILIYHPHAEKTYTAIRQSDSNRDVADIQDDWLLYDLKFSMDNLEILTLQELLDFNRDYPKILFYTLVAINDNSSYIRTNKNISEINELTNNLKNLNCKPSGDDRNKKDNQKINTEFNTTRIHSNHLIDHSSSEDIPRQLYTTLSSDEEYGEIEYPEGLEMYEPSKIKSNTTTIAHRSIRTVNSIGEWAFHRTDTRGTKDTKNISINSYVEPFSRSPSPFEYIISSHIKDSTTNETENITTTAFITDYNTKYATQKSEISKLVLQPDNNQAGSNTLILDKIKNRKRQMHPVERSKSTPVPYNVSSKDQKNTKSKSWREKMDIIKRRREESRQRKSKDSLSDRNTLCNIM
ncbi:hypothetical protein TBLA_0D01660 [Henningerozyma blattae CBS 6284]|uniref:Protein GIS4 n=1 Tax=Henningerozyma blattae (strain ATCC 34711 / CBS 6284 / DSM 70876 / NBRC 10599 / NRRL Y-10934 / UCD 77-7) TaxID=1071380 RepID=I2H2S2_HENB6|nr:hypothetical protein TBLA_0D01660 [Tetrapisispora blattae CBS 6284]CCH60674.1 hypothetical protein TBLA_0D01660 [Tetrapisispora blattae CBS 6284]